MEVDPKGRRGGRSYRRGRPGNGHLFVLHRRRSGRFVALRLPAFVTKASVRRQLRPTGAVVRHSLSLPHAIGRRQVAGSRRGLATEATRPRRTAGLRKRFRTANRAREKPPTSPPAAMHTGSAGVVRPRPVRHPHRGQDTGHTRPGEPLPRRTSDPESDGTPRQKRAAGWGPRWPRPRRQEHRRPGPTRPSADCGRTLASHGIAALSSCVC